MIFPNQKDIRQLLAVEINTGQSNTQNITICLEYKHGSKISEGGQSETASSALISSHLIVLRQNLVLIDKSPNG